MMMIIGVAMILRVYAIYNRSRIILGVLLLIYTTQVAILIVASSIYSSPNNGIVSVEQELDTGTTNCMFMLSTQTWYNASMIVKFILGTVMCSLVMAQFVRDSLQMYQATRKWQLNRYMTLLVREGLVYFLVTLLYNIINMLYILGGMSYSYWPQWLSYLFSAATNVPLYTLAPRFVMNIRELYVLDMQGRCDRDIDTGFGLSSGAGHGVGGSTTIGTIAFVEGGGSGGVDDEEMATAEEMAEGGSGQVLMV
ncbi:hypothetical protein OG21DRAFT_308140 [Imleria badia]|nr:hypothetical protein OG21DRAFT_308140 [Imleria badia]